MVNAHGYRQYLDFPSGRLLDLASDLSRAFYALRAQRETVDYRVGQMQRTDIRYIGQSGSAVDQNVIVGALHVRAQRVEELTAVQLLIEGVPVERAQRVLVDAVVLLPRRKEMNGAIVGEPPAHRYDEIAYVPNRRIDNLGDLPCPLSSDVQHSPTVGLVDRPLVSSDEIDDARFTINLCLHERLEKPVQTGRLQVPVRN
jgi:hypothetical protein